MSETAQTYIPEEFDSTNLDHIEIIKRVIPDMRTVDSFHNPVKQVMFRAGMLAMREMILALPENESASHDAGFSIIEYDSVEKCWPTDWLGDDPGTPRKMDFSELMEDLGNDHWIH